MRSIFSLSDAGHSLVLILLFFALIFQMYVCCIGLFLQGLSGYHWQNLIHTGSNISPIA